MQNRAATAKNATASSGRAARTARYPDIGDHGLIGDLQTAALVTTDGVSHLSLISAAVNLGHQLGHGAGSAG